MKGIRLQKRAIWIGAIILLIAGFGLYLRIHVVQDTEVDEPLRADASEYYYTAYNLVKNGVYTMSTEPGAVLRPDNFRWPGQPLLIATFMAHWPDHLLIVREIQWINIIAGTATLILIGAAATMVFPAWAAISVVLLTAISPHLLSLTVYILTETPAAFFVALLLALCAGVRRDDAERRPYLMVVLGVVIGLLALFRPIFVGFVPLMALAVPRDRLKCLILVVVGAAVPVAPWLIRNMLADGLVTTPSALAETMVIGAYPDYMFNGEPRTFPFPQSYDPNFLKVSATVTTAIDEILRRVAADPWGMAAWYFLRKPIYLWQFVNIDGVGDVLVYPVRTSPFNSNLIFALTHDNPALADRRARCYRFHSGVAAAHVGAFAESCGLVLRTASLLLIFLTVTTFPLNDPARFAVPVLPALFLTAMVLPVVLARWISPKAVMDTPKIPPASFTAGMEPVIFEIQLVILKLLIQKALISKEDACRALRQMHERAAEQDGTVGNVNAASAIRTVMLGLGCSVPDHQ